MKLKIYKNPVISAVLLNLISMIFIMCIIKSGFIILILMVIPVSTANRKIIDNGINMNRKKKAVILVSFWTMMTFCMIHFLYMRNVI